MNIFPHAPATDPIAAPSPQIWVRLAQAQRWIRVTATLLTLSGLIVIGAGGYAWASLFLEAPPVGQMMFALSIFLGCLFLIPAVMLFRYALQIRTATGTRAIGHLLAAFRAQQRLWTFATAMLIIYLALCTISWIVRKFYPEFS